MSRTIKLRKGLDIKLVGEADKVKTTTDHASNFAIKPPDFHGLVPKMAVKVGDKVKAGDTIMKVYHGKHQVDKVKYIEKKFFANVIKISKSKVAKPETIYEIVE